MPQKRKWSLWRLVWVLWIVAFLVIEGFALYRKHTLNEDDNTLSEFVWDYIVLHPIGWIGIAVLLGWLIWHFLFQKNRD